MAKKKDKKDKKLHNSDEKLHNSHELDLSWQETVDLIPEDEREGGSEIYYFTDEDGNIHSREFLAEELIDDNIEESKVSQEGKSRLEKVQRLKPGTTDVVNLVRTPEETSKEVILSLNRDLHHCKFCIFGGSHYIFASFLFLTIIPLPIVFFQQKKRARATIESTTVKNLARAVCILCCLLTNIKRLVWLIHVI